MGHYPSRIFLCLTGVIILCRGGYVPILQADLDNLKSIAVLGIIHGAAEVVERSTMVVIDHICPVIRKRTPAPWESFRTPRRERLMADIAVMAVWRRRWKRHISVAIITTVSVELWTSTNLLEIVQGRINEFSNHPCKMPFT